jgi:flagellar motor switch protein FliN/FliY
MKIKDVDFPELAESNAGRAVVAPNLSFLKHVDVTLEVKMGEVSLTVAELFALRAGSLLKLNRLIDEPVDILLNGKVVAAGQLAVLGEHLGVRITEVRNGDAELPR